MRPIKGAKNHVFLGPHLGPQKVRKKVPKCSQNGTSGEPKWRSKSGKNGRNWRPTPRTAPREGLVRFAMVLETFWEGFEPKIVQNRI